MSRVHEAWRRSQMSDDSASPSPSIEAVPAAAVTVTDAESSADATQPTALFPLRESNDPAAEAATFDAAAERMSIAPDTHSRRNQSFEELIREIARDEERMRLTSRAAPLGASLLPRP
jgi:hypothetical protein